MRRFTRRRQRGGAPSISYTNNIDSIEMNKKYKLQMLGDGEQLCFLEFIRAQEHVVELTFLYCTSRKLADVRFKSYLIIRRFLEILKTHGIQYVFLYPLPDVSKGFTRLFNFYKQMGFVCLGNDLQLNEFLEMKNEERMIYLQDKIQTSDSLLEVMSQKDHAGTLSSENILMLGQKECSYMLGDVDSIIAKITGA
jgi:hypothetical protein